MIAVHQTPTDTSPGKPPDGAPGIACLRWGAGPSDAAAERGEHRETR